MAIFNNSHIMNFIEEIENYKKALSIKDNGNIIPFCPGMICNVLSMRQLVINSCVITGHIESTRIDLPYIDHGDLNLSDLHNISQETITLLYTEYVKYLEGKKGKKKTVKDVSVIVSMHYIIWFCETLLISKHINYKNYKSAWNKSANTINQRVLKENVYKLHIYTEDKKPKKLLTIELYDGDDSFNFTAPSRKLFDGLYDSKLSGMPIDIPDDPKMLFLKTFISELKLQKNNPVINNISSYNEIVNYMIKNIITIHSNRITRCSISRNAEDILNFIKGLIRELNTGRKDFTNMKLVFFQNKKKHVSKTLNLFCKCPCIKTINGTLESCDSYFDLIDPSNKEFLYDVVNKNQVNNDFDDVNNAYTELNKFISQIINNDDCRLHPVCPKCKKSFKNEEGYNNLMELNPINKHPTDVKCPECDYEFCTDCKKVHKGKICSGLSDEYKNAQACPKCRSPTYRIEGCTFIHCTVCTSKWCWVCRCLRPLEYSTQPHYCITTDRYLQNPDWRNNIDLVPLISESPDIPIVE